jgi:hypothetical protein
MRHILAVSGTLLAVSVAQAEMKKGCYVSWFRFDQANSVRF